LPILYDVSLADADHGVAVGFQGNILRTTDGGVTWTLVFGGTSESLNSVSMSSADVGTIVGSLGVILRTTDGGITWVKQTCPSRNDFRGVSFSDADHGTAVGLYGTILRTNNGGVTFVNEGTLPGVPENYSLSNNFPNPFNPTTRIRYSIPNVSRVLVKIYDVLGNEIETLVDQEKPAGTYELNWNAEGLPSGVYFYQLKAGEFIQTKKMILLK
jgi:hypothetical protein